MVFSADSTELRRTLLNTITDIAFNYDYDISYYDEIMTAIETVGYYETEEFETPSNFILALTLNIALWDNLED